MKLKNVHYEYRGNDTWRIYFKDCQEAEAFENERADGKKPECGVRFINSLGIRYYVEAKLTVKFSILRHYVKDPTNDRFSNDVWRALVKKIEGADADYIFDEIDLWYDATFDKCYFRICCMNGTWTEFFIKNMLNSQFGMVAQANGYYDTDTAYRGGLCVRRSCCGIGFGQHRNKYGNTEERIIFTVKNFCRGEADIVKVSPWTNTFIGTNKENEKEYSWNDFKKYMGLLHANGSDIWDIEWKYDKTCPMTGTEVADKLHLYLKPLAYKKLFEKEEREEGKKIWISSNATLWSNADYLERVQALTPPPVPYWVNLDEDCKVGFRQKDMDEVQKEIDEMTKRIHEKLEIKFDTDTATREYRKREADIYKEMLDTDASIKDFSDDVVCEYCEQDLKLMSEELAKDIKEDNNMGTKLKYVENVKMTAQLNEEQLKVWEAALGIGNLPKHRKEKTVGEVVNGFNEEQKKVLYYLIAEAQKSGKSETAVTPTKILIQGTATIIWWSDGDKTVVKCQKGDKMDPEKGIAMAVMKKFMGTNKTGSNYLDFAKDAIAKYEKQKQEAAKKRKQAADKKRRAQKKEADANKEV